MIRKIRRPVVMINMIIIALELMALVHDCMAFGAGLFQPGIR